MTLQFLDQHAIKTTVNSHPPFTIDLTCVWEKAQNLEVLHCCVDLNHTKRQSKILSRSFVHVPGRKKAQEFVSFTWLQHWGQLRDLSEHNHRSKIRSFWKPQRTISTQITVLQRLLFRCMKQRFTDVPDEEGSHGLAWPLWDCRRSHSCRRW